MYPFLLEDFTIYNNIHYFNHTVFSFYLQEKSCRFSTASTILSFPQLFSLFYFDQSFLLEEVHIFW